MDHDCFKAIVYRLNINVLRRGSTIDGTLMFFVVVCAVAFRGGEGVCVYLVGTELVGNPMANS